MSECTLSSVCSIRDWWTGGSCLSPCIVPQSLVQLLTMSYSPLGQPGQTSQRSFSTLFFYKAKILPNVPSPPTYVQRLCSPQASHLAGWRADILWHTGQLSLLSLELPLLSSLLPVRMTSTWRGISPKECDSYNRVRKNMVSKNMVIPRLCYKISKHKLNMSRK